jgi:hypothetical protein
LLEVKSDSDYARAPDTQISVSGYIFCAAPISSKSKVGTSVALEAKYYASSENYNEVILAKKLLPEEFGIQ